MNDVRVDPDQFDLPEPEIPEAELDEDTPLGICNSRWDLGMRIRRLIASRNYGNEDEA